ncbi:hypothetical protein EXS73_01155 [Candidatus Pacearchaeota archaeon]|nr:hypothetical protein [Candidatus Pacearchaeota archaeon]
MKYWFKRKDYGWGWKPATWQGKLMIGLWVIGMYYSYALANRFSYSISDTLYTVLHPWTLYTFIIWLICWCTGDRPRWQWKKKK